MPRWRDSVVFTSGGMAFRRDELLVRSGVADVALEQLRNREYDREALETEDLPGGWKKVSRVTEPLRALAELRSVGVFAQPNHVLFANACCPPHPSTLPIGADPMLANPMLANPMLANPMLANPMLANPMLANPMLANALGGGCCCGCTGSTGLVGKPMLANTNPNPGLYPRRRSSVRPTEKPANPAEPCPSGDGSGVRVVVLDTGYAHGKFQPQGLPINIDGYDPDAPDQDKDGYLDLVAGHGTFIAGVIAQIAPATVLEVSRVLAPDGEGLEDVIGKRLFDLVDEIDDQKAKGEDPKIIVNMSFGGYSPIGMGYLAQAAAELHKAGAILVASSGNEAICIPTYPAVLPDVVSVGALDQDGWPAEYTNFGPWVRACTIGSEVVSTFFTEFDGAEPPVDGQDIDKFEGWAVWSGTSFAAPRVAAALACEWGSGKSRDDVIRDLIDNDKAEKRPMLGTVVLP